jgi:predicted dehydrogenase
MRILILGCGQAARTHARILSRRSGVDLMFASRDGARAEAYCRRFSGRASFGSYEHALLRDADLVLIATPPVAHRDLALQALRSGKNVAIEKPAFMRASDCDIVARASRDARRRVFVAENYPYKPIARFIRAAVTRGELGDVRFLSINATRRQPSVGWRADHAMGGYPMLEGGVHWMSFVAGIGLEIVKVRGLNAGSDLSTLVVFRFAGGGVGTLAYSRELAAPFGGLRLSKLQGTTGAVTFESNGLAAVFTGRRRGIRLDGVLDPTGSRAMWRDFLSALHTGAEPAYTLDMAQRDLRHVEDASASFDARDLDVEDQRGMGRDRAVLPGSVGIG